MSLEYSTRLDTHANLYGMSSQSTSVIFLDFEGVILIQSAPSSRYGFSPDRMEIIKQVCEDTLSSIVVSSDYRLSSSRQAIEQTLSPQLDKFLHQDWATPVYSQRWQEVAAWLMVHPHISRYSILEDTRSHFADAPDEMKERIIWIDEQNPVDETAIDGLRMLLNRSSKASDS